MPWNTNGTFTRENPDFDGDNVWQQDQQASIKIIASRHDFHDQDIADGIQETLNIDGYNAMRADLNMGGFSLINLAAGSAEDDVALIGQLIDSGTFDNPLRELTLHTPIGDLDPIVIPAGDTTSTEGEWTPQITDNNNNDASMSTVNGGYWQRDGRVVTIFGFVKWLSRVSSTRRMILTGMPFDIAPAYVGGGYTIFTAGFMGWDGMILSGISSLQGGEAFTEKLHAVAPQNIGISTYLAANDEGDNLIYPHQMDDIESNGEFSFTMKYTTDDPL
jgi:hypothetical protein